MDRALDAPARRRKPWLGLLLGLGLLLLIEGLASAVLAGYDLAFNATRPLAERAHTRHDDELGWVNLTSHAAPDLYGPGLDLHTNALGLRGTREYAEPLPAGRLRALCAGDSFTLGYGVGDADTWPAQVEGADPGLECPNLGQGGYGIDQCWLWYRRMAPQLAHQAVVFAFIADDFRRLQLARFSGYDKPLLGLSADGGLYVQNAPVPRDGIEHPWLAANARLFEGLRALQLARRALGRLGARAAAPPSLPEESAERVASALFAELARDCRAHGRRLLLLHLPAQSESALGGLSRLDGWGRRALEGALAQGAEYLDLLARFDEQRGAARAALFLAPGAVDFPGARGHYTRAGNALVAEAVRAWLRAPAR